MIWNKPRFMLSKVQQLWRKLWGWTPLYWLRCHTFTRYHIIDIRGQDNYKWGWIDRSHAMYLACFALLVDFVEKENPDVGLLTDADYRGDPSVIDDAEWNECHKPFIDHQIEREREVRAIYDWWKVGRQQERGACNALYDAMPRRTFDQIFVKEEGSQYSTFVRDESPEHAAWMKEYDRFEAKDEEMLMRLMKVRCWLWT